MKKRRLPKRILTAVACCVVIAGLICQTSCRATGNVAGNATSGTASDASSDVPSSVSSNVSSSVPSDVSSDVSSSMSSDVPSDVASNVSSTATGDVITFQQALGLTAPQIAKISIFFGGCTVETSDPQKISALMDSLKEVKLKDAGPRQDTMVGEGYIVDFYPEKGKGNIEYVLGGLQNFTAMYGYTGPVLQDAYQPLDFDEMGKILHDFWVGLGGKP